MAPESIEGSKLAEYLNEHFTYKISDLLKESEILSIYETKEKLIEGLSKYPFLKISEDKETISYIIDEKISVFKIQYFPMNLSKMEIASKLEIFDLKYDRFYKRNIYWLLVTNDKETQICVKNSLRELYIEDIKIKFENYSYNQLLKNMKEGIEKLTYKNEVKNLCVSPKDKRKNSNFSSGSNNKSNYYKNRPSNISDHFSWRKGSNISSGKKYDNKYYNKSKKFNYKRSRFNSDPDNRYKNAAFDEELEIDVSSLKYPLNIKFKYSFKDVKSYLECLKKNNFLSQQPKFLSDGIDEIIIKNADQHKEILVLDSLIEEFEKVEEIKDNYDKDNNKIPRVNPLSSLPKMFNKFDMVAGNIPQWNTFVCNDNAPKDK